MQNKLKTQSLLLALIFCVSFIGAPFVFGAIPKNKDVEMGVKLIENKIDFLIASLEEDPNITISENFKESSHIYKWIHYAVKNPDVPIYQEVLKAGQLHESDNPLEANIHLNQTIKKLLELVRVHEDLDAGTLDVVDALIALLDASPEAYGRGNGIITSVASRPKGTTKEAYELLTTTVQTVQVPVVPVVPVDPKDPDPDPDPVYNFRYYGKLYNLDNVIMHDDGTLEFTEGGVASGLDPGRAISTMSERDSAAIPPFLTPVFGYGGVREGGEPIESSYSVSLASASGSIPMENSSYRRYTWNVLGNYGNSPVAANASAILFEDTENSVIVFDYYNDPNVVRQFENYDRISESFISGLFYDAAAGLFMGDHSEGNPGYPIAIRDWATGIADLYGFLAEHPLTYTGDLYTAISNMGFDGEYADFNAILFDTMYVFWPEHWNTDEDWGPHYRGTLVSRNMVHDSASTLTAIDGIINDHAERTAILAGKYFPGTFESTTGRWTGGNYQYGLQTVGSTVVGTDDNGKYILEPTLFISDFGRYFGNEWLSYVNSDGLLAYIIQEDEDYVNREIARRAVNTNGLLDSVNNLLKKERIRGLDAALDQLSDAQGGRVFKDRKGNWVRVQQYAMRSDDNTQVQFLSLTHRGSGPDAGFSAIDFRVTAQVNYFEYNGVTYQTTPDFGQYPDLRGAPWNKWLNTQSGDGGPYVLTDASAPHLNNMFVEVSNPHGDVLREKRYFAVPDQVAININGEELKVNSSTYTNDYTPGGSLEYSINASGFDGYYDATGEQKLIDVSFYELGDDNVRSYNSEGELDPSSETFQDIWDAMRVNEPGAPNIDESSLEIAFNNVPDRPTLLNNEIDVIYIPMSRMLWKSDRAEATDDRSTGGGFVVSMPTP